jgi:hypothetical protein
MITRFRLQSTTDVMGKTAKTAQRDCNPEHNPIGESCVDDHRTVLSSPEARFTRLPVQQHPRRGWAPKQAQAGSRRRKHSRGQCNQLRRRVRVRLAMICLKWLWSRMRAMQVALEAV